MTIAFFTKLRDPLQVSVRSFTQRLDYHLVPRGGLEPPRLSTLGFESSASTDFATRACDWSYYITVS